VKEFVVAVLVLCQFVTYLGCVGLGFREAVGTQSVAGVMKEFCDSLESEIGCDARGSCGVFEILSQRTLKFSPKRNGRESFKNHAGKQETELKGGNKARDGFLHGVKALVRILKQPGVHRGFVEGIVNEVLYCSSVVIGPSRLVNQHASKVEYLSGGGRHR
jgi:hypothetical protein